MVITKNLKQKYALISVFDKKDLRYLCANLSKYNYKFIAKNSKQVFDSRGVYKKYNFKNIVYC